LSEEGITYKITADISEVAKSIGELNRLLTTYVALARRLGIEGDIIDAIAKFQRLRIAAQTAYTSIITLYTATGPIGWAIGAGGLLMGGLMFGAELGGEGNRLEREFRSRRWGN